MSRHRKGIEPSWGSKNWPFYVCGTMIIYELPSGKHTKNYGKSPCLMGKSTISMAIFNSYVKLPEARVSNQPFFSGATPCLLWSLLHWATVIQLLL
jgi:hypothetical protein